MKYHQRILNPRQNVFINRMFLLSRPLVQFIQLLARRILQWRVFGMTAIIGLICRRRLSVTCRYAKFLLQMQNCHHNLEKYVFLVLLISSLFNSIYATPKAGSMFWWKIRIYGKTKHTIWTICHWMENLVPLWPRVPLNFWTQKMYDRISLVVSHVVYIQRILPTLHLFNLQKMAFANPAFPSTLEYPTRISNASGPGSSSSLVCSATTTPRRRSAALSNWPTTSALSRMCHHTPLSIFCRRQWIGATSWVVWGSLC